MTITNLIRPTLRNMVAIKAGAGWAAIHMTLTTGIPLLVGVSLTLESKYQAGKFVSEILIVQHVLPQVKELPARLSAKLELLNQ